MKAHFAGHVSFIGALKLAGVNYILDTYYEIRNLKDDKAREHVAIMNSYKHAICDSGLFTLMFGAKAGTAIDESFIYQWQNSYAEFLNKYQFKHSFVECDVQKILSPEFAWEMRKLFRKQVTSGAQIINVYHLEDENPDKLIDHADYIAISQPELRLNLSNDERYKLTRYIASKAAARGKRVHLLGCTEIKMMKEFQYCFSCDSTSWLMGGKFNNFFTTVDGVEGSKKHIDVTRLKGNVPEALEGKPKSFVMAYWQAVMKKQEYLKYAGEA